MKPLIYIGIATGTLLSAGIGGSSAQQPPAAPYPPAGSIAQAQEAAEKAQALADKAQALADKTRDEADDFGDKPMRAPGRVKGLVTPNTPMPPGARGINVNVMGHGPAAASKSFVIRSSSSDPEEQANLEKDLTVMSHLLDKSVEELPGGQRHRDTTFGIDLFFAPGSNPMRSLYLDGYGAVFLVNVSFPLLPPPQKVETAKPATNSDWQSAWDEVYGQRGEGKFPAGPSEEFNEDKVSKLKETLFETLKNATNIRGLKPDDSITICVFGGSSSSRARAKASAKRMVAKDGGDVMVLQDGGMDAPGRQTVLTLRVKKSDVDSYAKGKVNLDEFQKRARLTAYATGTGPAAGGFGYINEFHTLGDARF
jgi:hypothetical protein